MNINYQIKSYIGKDIAPFVDDLGEIRLEVFKEFPYLYDGDLETERKYLSEYVNSDKSIMLGLFADEQLVGFITGTSLDSGLSIVADAYELFSSQNLSVNDYYYLGELIIMPKHRSFSWSSKLIKQIEAFAKSNKYSALCFLTVIRTANHPMKPIDYKDTASLWKIHKAKRMNLTSSYDWQTIINPSQSLMQTNQLEFWEKAL